MSGPWDALTKPYQRPGWRNGPVRTGFAARQGRVAPIRPYRGGRDSRRGASFSLPRRSKQHDAENEQDHPESYPHEAQGLVGTDKREADVAYNETTHGVVVEKESEDSGEEPRTREPTPAPERLTD